MQSPRHSQMSFTSFVGDFTENIKKKLIEMNVSEKTKKKYSLFLGQGDIKGLLDCEDFDDEWEETKQLTH